MKSKIILIILLSILIVYSYSWKINKKILIPIISSIEILLCLNINKSNAYYNDYIISGMNNFRNGNVKQSLLLYNKAINEYPEIKDYLWQLGISYYVNKQYNECSQQFTNDYKNNPNDSEEVLWAFLCNAQANNNNIQLAQQLMPITLRNDPRQYMKTIESVYRGIDNEEKLISIINSNNSNTRDVFYSALYLALLKQAENNDNSIVRQYLDMALSSSYINNSRDYMTSVAKVLRQQL